MAKQGTGAHSVLSRILAVIFSVCAFAGVVLVYRYAFHVDEEVALEQQSVQAEAEQQEPVSDDNGYEGVEDPWTGGFFTTGDKELDAQVKAFCDALTVGDKGATGNAQTTYNQIVWSTYLARTEEEMALGPDWDIAAARQFFSGGDPQLGIGGGGDCYEYAATAAFCMRYFGFYDAVAAPVISNVGTESEGHNALVLLSDEYGQACVLDPSKGADGWMGDRDLYYIVIDDAGEDTAQFESMGYTIRSRSEDVSTGTESDIDL